MRSHSIVTVRRKPAGAGTMGLLTFGSRTIQCALGRSGMSAFKTEGDGATPAPCVMRAEFGFFRHDRVRRPETSIPFFATRPDNGWCDAPTHPAYNMPVQLPFCSSHELMMRDDVLYNVCVVLDFNRGHPDRRRFGGSAIFLHCAKPGFTPTLGCIAVAQPDLLSLLCAMSPRTRIVVDH